MLITEHEVFTWSPSLDPLYRLICAEGREHAAQNNVQQDERDFERAIGIPFPNSPEALQRYIEDYEYDSVGNILRLHHTGGAVERWIRRYQYALDSNRLLATKLPGDPGNLPDYSAKPGYSAKYTYDSDGNMTAMPHLPVMEWDFKDHLHSTQRQVVNNGGIAEKTYYVYDAYGQRVRKVTELAAGMVNDERIYLGGFEIFRRAGANPLVRETLHVMDDKRPIALVETKTITNPADSSPAQLIRYQFGNHLGSASLELDDQAQIVSYEEYTPYGNTSYQAVRSQTETPKRYWYTGKERDEESGLYYHGARYYAPWLGRWVSCDPSGIDAGFNFYRYARNRPTAFVDPNGKQECSSTLCAESKFEPLSKYLSEIRANEQKDLGAVVTTYNLISSYYVRREVAGNGGGIYYDIDKSAFQERGFSKDDIDAIDKIFRATDFAPRDIQRSDWAVYDGSEEGWVVLRNATPSQAKRFENQMAIQHDEQIRAQARATFWALMGALAGVRAGSMSQPTPGPGLTRAYLQHWPSRGGATNHKLRPSEVSPCHRVAMPSRAIRPLAVCRLA